MAITVRGLSDEVEVMLTKAAKETHRSREEFIREQLTRIAYQHADETSKQFFDAVLDKSLKVIEMNTQVMLAIIQSGVIPNVFVKENGKVDSVKQGE